MSIGINGCYDNAWGCADRLVEMAQRMEEPACQR